jgi:alkyl sulfatase BDS1-like metallo-beta-lactamase superfamily hydrolase
VVGGLNPAPEHLGTWFLGVTEPPIDTLFHDAYAFDVGGRRFECYHTPGGETMDGIIVWLPADRTVFAGNLLGALHGALPNLYPARGDRARPARLFIESVDRVLKLEPEVLVNGHDAPVVGADRIRRDLTRVRDAVQYIHDATVKGMNEGTDLFTLMREIQLPDDLRREMPPGRCPVSWCVRAVWEEHAGFFRHESTTELYGVPSRAIWTELAELAGGPDVLAQRAAAHVAAGQPVEALHFVEIALAADPKHRGARQAQIGALEQLLDRTGGEPYDEVHWLETELALVEAVLAADEPAEGG